MLLALIIALIAFIALNFARRLWKTPKGRRVRFVVREMAVLGLIYVGFLIMLLFFEKSLVFPASAVGGWEEPGTLKVEEVWLAGADGANIHAWWCPLPDAKFVVHYSHGNAGNLSHRKDAIRDWQQALGASVLIYDYPGYGKSSGTPSEAGCCAAGQGAYDWLRQKQSVLPERIVLYGKSLGGGVATELAMKNPHRMLVLYCTFTSVPDMAQSMFPFFPARYLVRTQFNNLDKIARYRGPVLIGHGTGDTIIPFKNSERLYEAAGQARWKKLELYPGMPHNQPPIKFLQEAASFLQSDITTVTPAQAP